MTNRQLAAKIVDDIVDDLQDRRGLRQEWDQIDDDVKQQILIKWIDIAESYIKEKE